MQLRFVERPQALLHGDLHTGSMLVTQNSTKVRAAPLASEFRNPKSIYVWGYGLGLRLRA